MSLKKNSIKIFMMVSCLAVLFGCKGKKNQKEEKSTNKQVQQDWLSQAKKELPKANFDTLIDGKQTDLYWIHNDSIYAVFTNYGGRIVGLWVPGENGKMIDVVAGMNSVKGYVESTEPYFGATIGRVGNRIAKGKFTLNGKQYTIPTNNGENTLHGGVKGFQYEVWRAQKTNAHTLVFTYDSPDGEQGFPGDLKVNVTYSLTQDRTLKIEYQATTDKTTPVNLTNHAFFNLNGEGSGSVLQHQLMINADSITPVDDGLIPTGEMKAVVGTPFDFRKMHAISDQINADNQQLKNGKGYDHNFVLNKDNKTGRLTQAAKVVGNKSGVVMDVYTQEPGLQFYSGNFMEGKNTFKSGVKDAHRTAFALETQHFPDTPNQKNFPSITLNPKDEYHTVSEYHFSTK